MARLVGKTELSGGGVIEQGGIYGWIRHPRYAGSFLAILGACCLSKLPRDVAGHATAGVARAYPRGDFARRTRTPSSLWRNVRSILPPCPSFFAVTWQATGCVVGEVEKARKKNLGRALYSTSLARAERDQSQFVVMQLSDSSIQITNAVTPRMIEGIATLAT